MTTDGLASAGPDLSHIVEPGEITLLIDASSAGIRLTAILISPGRSAMPVLITWLLTPQCPRQPCRRTASLRRDRFGNTAHRDAQVRHALIRLLHGARRDCLATTANTRPEAATSN